ncbi:UNVERIFIED_CONTAM: hypothetical protein K2H54_056366 [Gekko kuhli]
MNVKVEDHVAEAQMSSNGTPARKAVEVETALVGEFEKTQIVVENLAPISREEIRHMREWKKLSPGQPQEVREPQLVRPPGSDEDAHGIRYNFLKNPGDEKELREKIK